MANSVELAEEAHYICKLPLSKLHQNELAHPDLFVNSTSFSFGTVSAKTK